MAVPRTAVPHAGDLAEPLTPHAAYAYARRAALTDSPVGPVGLEVEAHLVDLESVADTVAAERIGAIPAALRRAAGRSAVTLEPGGQVELSGPPAPDVLTAVGALRRDLQRTRLALADLGLGVAYLGADPLREPCRINQRPRYQAMERHYAATGRSAAGAVMMNSTAAIQVNLDAGPERDWAQRWARAHRLGPTLVALSASSPWLCGRDTGWKSCRQRAWRDLGAWPTWPRGGADPASDWASYALRAPVVFVPGPGGAAAPVPATVPFERWAGGAVRLGGRAPTAADLDIHLSTLFPPVRARGYLELRYLDMSAPRWWPAVAAVATVLMDDPAAASLADEATERTAPLWTEAARYGLAHPLLAQSARRCLAIAADRVPAALAPAVADLAELVGSGRCPGDLLAERIGQIGVRAAFAEVCHA